MPALRISEVPVLRISEGGAVGARVRASAQVVGADFDDLSVTHEVAPRLDDAHIVAARPERADDIGGGPLPPPGGPPGPPPPRGGPAPPRFRPPLRRQPAGRAP